MKKYLLITIFGLMFWGNNAFSATFYIDGGCGTPGDGTTPTCDGDANDSYDDLDDFTEAARTAGDIAKARRSATATDNGTDLTFTSSGTVNTPITLEADYDNVWGDFASSSQTYTVTRGAKQLTASTTISDIAAGDWIYVYNDKTRRRDFAYEVASVVDTVLTLYLPYKGDNPGAGRTLTIMPDAPFWNVTTGDFQWSSNNDDYWMLRGFDVRGTDSACNMTFASSIAVVKDMVLKTNKTSSCALGAVMSKFYMSKSRTFGHIGGLGNATAGAGYYSDILVDCDSGTSSFGIGGGEGNYYVDSIEIKNCTDSFSYGTTTDSNFYFRNIIGPHLFIIPADPAMSDFYFEDKGSVVGSNSFMTGKTNNLETGVQTISKNTTTVRVGGGASSIEVRPPTGTAGTGISTNYFPNSYLKLFEYPIYLNTSATTITTWFKPANTASWTADPLVTELWVEIDVLASASKAYRYTKRSTGTLNFNGDSDWQSLTIPVIASQSGNAYLRAWYGKPVETIGTDSTDNNRFYVDVKPVLTQ